jgi:tetratricopeptide (TPR) repeat protein
MGLNQLVASIIISYSLYYLFSCVFGFYDKKAIKSLKSLTPKKIGHRERLVKVLAKSIKLNPDTKSEMEILLHKSKQSLTPEEFCVKTLLKSLGCLIIGLILLSVKMGVSGVVLILLSLLIYFNSKIKLKEKADSYEDKIIKELPQFIGYLIQSLQTEQDLIKIINKYRAIANKELKSEIDILLTELRTGSYELALINFDKRMNVQTLTYLVSGLINANKGVDQRLYLQGLEQEVRQIFMKKHKKELNERPKKIKWASTAVLLSFLVITSYPVLVYIYEHLRTFY